MEPLIKRDDYLKRVNKLVQPFPKELFIGSFILVILYHTVELMILQEIERLIGFTMLSEMFFQGTAITVVIYLFKSRYIGNVVRTKPTDFTDKEVQGYLPVVMGTNLRKQKVGYLLIENNELALHLKKAGGYVREMTWKDLTKVEVTVVKETYNIVLLLIYGFRESILVTDGEKSVKVIFPMAHISVEEIKESIKSNLTTVLE